VDIHVDAFLKVFDGQWEKSISGKPPQKPQYMETTPLALFTHAISHEFHHKGQIMTMGRILGNIPPDTDIIRF
jgi:uncharacterized damage-inducible protein DinB